MDMIIFGGQSNMQGQTESLPSPNPIIENALEYRMAEDALVPLCHPVGEDLFDCALLGAHEGHGSLIPAFCRAYTEISGRPAVAVHVSKGSTTLSQWMPPNSRHYIAAEKKVNAAKDCLRRNGITVDRIRYVWLQGESDALKETDEETYLSRLIAYKNTLKEAFGIEKFGIIRVGYFSKKHENDEAIMRAQERAAADDSDFVMLTRITAKLSLDPVYLNPHAAGHYNNFAMERLGETAGSAFGALR